MNTKKPILLALAAMMLASCPISIIPTSSSSSSSATTSETNSAEDSSSEEPTSSEEPSSEEPASTEEPVSSSESSEEPTSSSSEESSETSSSESSESSSSEESQSSEESSSSEEAISADASISFNLYSSVTSALTSVSADQYAVEGLQIDSIVCSNVFATGKSSPALRIGGSQKGGSLTVNLREGVCIRSLWLDAKGYRTDTPILSLEMNGYEGRVNLDEEECYFDVEGQTEVTSFTLSAGASERVVVSAIYIEFGSFEEIYPTSISLDPSDTSLSVGHSLTLDVSYAPRTTNRKKVSFASSDSNILTVDKNGKMKGIAEGEAVVTATAVGADDASITAQCHVTVTPNEDVLEPTDIAYTYADYCNNDLYGCFSCPQTGEGNLLVIPVWFSDSSTFISESKREDVRSDIETAYFGSEDETGWHSVKSYYEAESFDALTLEGTVSEWYEAGESYKNYGSSSSGGNKTVSLVAKASKWYFDNHPEESRKDYDRDGNGFLDGVMLIYAAPDYLSLGNSNYSNLWAYCYWSYENDAEPNYQNPVSNPFFWCSYDFMYDRDTARSRTGKPTTNYGYGDCSHCTLDAHTFIHEMGHVLGLDDYYDYGNYSYSPAGSLSMQDYNEGGHDPYSVMAFGWADPYIPTSDISLTIGAFQTTHELILLTPEWNEIDSCFDEYLLLELYTPTGLNEFDATYPYGGSYHGWPQQAGIRLWHIDSRLVYVNEVRNNEPVFSDKNLTCDPRMGTYGVTRAFSNTYGNASYGSPLGSAYYNFDLLHLIRNNKTMSYKTQDVFSTDDLFVTGSSFDQNTYKSQFPKSATLNNGQTLGWSFTVEIFGSGAEAEATVHLVRE